MTIKRYPSYSKSGIEWLGEIPSNWMIKRIGYCFNERREKVSDKDFEPLSVTKNGIVPQLETAAKSDDGDNRKKVCDGDFVINSRSDRKGSSGASSLHGSVSLINTVITPNKNIDIKFAHYLFRSILFQEEYYRYGKGIVADLWSTNYSEMKSILIPLPPIEEQSVIANFLKNEVAKIDLLISEQQKLIVLLQEKRQALISNAVTKGLNSEAKMKNSGVDWIGTIPENWTLIPFRYCVDYCEGPGIMAVDFQMSGVPLIRISGVGERWVRLDGCNYLDPELVAKKWTHFRLKSRDLLISASASMGTVSEVNEETVGAVPYTGLIRLRPKTKNITRDFIRAFVVSSMFSKQIDELKTGATIQHFGPTHLAQIKMVLPSILEQEKITSYIDEATREYDDLITETQNALRLLDERRSVLISEAVTGKINVSNYQTSEIP